MALWEGKSPSPIVSEYNFCEAWKILPYPLDEMPNQLMEAYITIYNAREAKRKIEAESAVDKANATSMR